jgi:hypothetical protein
MYQQYYLKKHISSLIILKVKPHAAKAAAEGLLTGGGFVWSPLNDRQGLPGRGFVWSPLDRRQGLLVIADRHRMPSAARFVGEREWLLDPSLNAVEWLLDRSLNTAGCLHLLSPPRAVCLDYI